MWTKHIFVIWSCIRLRFCASKLRPCSFSSDFLQVCCNVSWFMHRWFHKLCNFCFVIICHNDSIVCASEGLCFVLVALPR